MPRDSCTGDDVLRKSDVPIGQIALLVPFCSIPRTLGVATDVPKSFFGEPKTPMSEESRLMCWWNVSVVKCDARRE